ncbi:MAG: autotransporter-associated beta strand repeat-containing protein [Brevundimonas sp.]|uniref:autotransporter-associated beta strand repeat-containing protein n=1 Tax=Brevundimonas sp. TaxID=1871086 RepID=UPI00391D3727
MRKSVFHRVGRERPEGKTERWALLTTTAMSAATALMVIAAHDVAAAQSIDFGMHEIVDGAGQGAGIPPSTRPAYWGIGGTLYIALNSGNGFLTIRNGGEVTSFNGGLGYQSRAEVTVTGAGSNWLVGQELTVGQSQVGILTISDGGVVDYWRAWLGRSASGVGDVIVTGADSAFTGGEVLFVGSNGGGNLTAADGGAVTVPAAFIGSFIGSIGEVTVTGAGSTWTSTTRLDVGGSGAGTLTIADGGAVSTGGLTLATSSVSSGVLNFGAAAGDAAAAAGTLNTPTIFFGNGAGSIVFNHTDDDFSLGANIHGAGTIRLLSGHTTLTGASTYTGSTLLEGGTLTLGSNGALGGSTLTTTGSVIDYADGVTIANPVVIDSNTTQFQVLTGSATQSGVVSELNGPRPFEKIGAGELVLTADNTWTGQTTVRGGALVIEGDNDQGAGGYIIGLADGDDGALIVREGGTLASGVITLGSASGATGVATVTGAGSLWASSGGLMVGDAGYGELQVLDSGAFSTNSLAFLGNQAGSTGAMTVAGAGSQFTSSTELYIGYQGTGALAISAGGQVANSVGFVGADGASNGSATVSGPNSLWANNDALHIGYYGTGLLEIADSGVVRVDGGTGVVNVGANTGSAGVLAIGAEAGEAAMAAGTLDAGEVRFGLGNSELVFNHTASDYVFAPLITGTGGVSHYAGTTILTADNSWNGLTAIHGGLLVIEGASNQAVGAYHVGQLAGDDGELILRAGGTIESGNVTIGTDSGAHGAVTVTGADSAWDVSGGNFRVGEDGVGILTISDGGSVNSYYGTVGLRAGGSGEATVTGSGSAWTVTSEFVVGSTGEGALLISDGGQITAGQGVIGGLAGAVGDVTVTGTGASWANSGALYVGYQGQGDLIVAQGATVSNNAGLLGSQTGSSGSARITGAGSVWSNSVLYVGALGAGALEIADGGVVRAGAGTGVVHVGFGAAGGGALSIGAAAGDAALGAGVLEAGEVRFGAGTGTLAFNHTETDYDFDVLITGAGQIDVLEGLTTLTRANTTFMGATTVAGGDLRVADVLGGQVTVSSGSLGGPGSVLGAVSVGAGSLVGEAGSVFTMGSLTLSSASVLDVTLGSPTSDALFDVAGDLTLDGTLDITDAGDFGAGVYGLITYGGSLTNNGLAIGDLPVGYSAGRLAVQTAVAGRINLVNAGLADLLFWDGGDPANADNGVIDGGDGTWTLASETWTDLDGAANGAMIPVPGLAVFMGTGGTVTLDDSAGALSVTGLQFVADGYVLTGDGLELVEETAGSGVNLRVGNGTAAGADWTATIASALSGATSVTKTDLGSLVLTGANSWTGETTVRNGALIFDGGSHTGTTYTLGRITGDDGALIIRNGGSVTNGDSFIGLETGASGSATVSGSGSQWSTSNQLAVGLNGAGAMIIADGGLVSSGWAGIGVNAGSAGVATVTGPGSRWNGSSVLTVGMQGVGALQVADGGVVTAAGQIYFGSLVGGHGEGTVTGAGSRLSTAQGLFVGSDGRGVLNILDGGVVESGMPWSSIGANADGQGVATVSGAGSLWSASGQLYVGAYGSGALRVLDGGAVTVAGSVLYVGANAGSQGEALVSGAGSTVTFNQLQIGSRGQGSLRVQDGASVAGTDAYVGAFGGGEGGLVVTGADSRMTLTGEAVIGAWGDGEAVLSDGGVLAAGGQVILAREAGVSGVLSIGAAAGGSAQAAGRLDVDALVFGAGTGSLVFNHTGTDYGFAASLSGAGTLRHLAGVTRLGGDSSAFTGTSSLTGGTLRVDGVLGGDVSVTGGALGGSGSVLGAVTIADGGTLSGVQGQTLGLGTLVLSEGSTVAVALGAAGDTALFDVAGDLTLDGALAVTDVGGFGAGVYRLFDYGGVLTDNGLDIASAPDGVSLEDLFVQTSVASQVNLVSSHEVDLRFWDGGGAADDGAVQGGSGTWSLSGRGWTGADGAVNGAYDNPAFAVFMGIGGTVTVDGAGVGITGMQFAVDGYAITGDGIELTEAETIIRVGDGTAAGAAMTATIASSLTGEGALVKTDLGVLVLTGTNSYAGGTFVRSGTLIGNTASLTGDIDNDATLVFDQGVNGVFAGAITGDGLTIKRGAGVLSLTGGSAMDWSVQTGGLIGQAGAFSGDVAVASGANFTLNANGNATWAGVLSGTGTFAKTGAGALALTGDSSAFDGTTEIRDGLLVLNGILGGRLRIADGAMLSGSGALAELMAEAGSVIAPGESIGTLNVTGDVTFEAGSIYEVEVDPTSGASDRIVAGGTATLNGGVVRHVGYPGAYGPSSTYTILTAVGGVTGAFEAIETDFAFLDASLTYQTNAVLMTLERNAVPFPAVGESVNQRATAAAVEAAGSGAALYDAVVGLNAGNARLAFDMLSGELHGSIRTARSEAAQRLAGTLGRRMDAARDIERGAAFWAEATGSRTRMAADGNAASLTPGAAGLMMGADAGFGAVRLGVAAGASDHDDASHARAGRAEGTSLSLAAYGSGQWEGLGLKGAVSGTWHEIETERRVVFPGFFEVLRADYDAQTVHAFVEASWRVDMGPAATLAPFVNLARVRTETDAFTETGGEAALAVQGRVQAASLATIGLGMSRSYHQGDGRHATLSGRLGWRHAWDDTAGDGRHAFAASPAPAFTVHGLPVAEDAMIAGLGLGLDLKDRLSLTVDWAGQYGSGLNANALAATLNWRF